MNKNNLTGQEFIRYSRQIMVTEVGEIGQLAFKNAKVIIVGMGGLGCSASQYLAASGIGKLTLIDHDVIEVSNLQRQILYKEQDIGKSKALTAQLHLQALNSTIEINALNQSVSDCDFTGLLKTHDLVLDCTDNATTRYFINIACVQEKTALVSASAIQTQGQLISFDFATANSPCYQCLFPDLGTTPQNCSSLGAFSPALGVMGSLQAVEAMSILLNKSSNINTLHVFDAWGISLKRIAIKRDKECRVCAEL